MPAESLDELEKFVLSSFSCVKNRQVTPTTFKYPDDHPWGAEQLKQQICVVPVMNLHFVELVFATPDVIDQYQTAVREIIFSYTY